MQKTTITSTKILITQTSGKTKFEQDLQTYFPDLYQFWSLFKFDPFMEEVLQGILEMVNTNSYGTMRVVWQNGKINTVNLDKQLTAHKAKKLRMLDK